MLDGKAFGQEVVGVVKTYMDKEMATLGKRLDGIEERLAAIPVAPTPEEVSGVVVLRLTDDLAEIRREALATIPSEIEKAVAQISAPKDGKDGTDGKDGESVTVDDVAPMIAEQVAKAVATVPVPKDGNDGADGVGLAGAIIDREGGLVVTLTNGETRNLGPVVGKDGAKGEAGLDGVGFDDFSVEHDGERNVTMKFTRGDTTREFLMTFPAVIYRGVYSHEKTYERGDQVTYAGSQWIAEADAEGRPDTGKGWVLSAKRGKDGRDGKDGDRGEKGATGKDGVRL